jgi:hypothetical protein
MSDLAQQFGLVAERFQMTQRLIDQRARLRLGTIQAQDRHESRLARLGIAPDRLAGLGGGTFLVQQIVGDLEGEPDVMGIGMQQLARFRRRLAQDGARLAREGDQRAGLQALQPGDGVESCSACRSIIWPPTMPAAPAHFAM